MNTKIEHIIVLMLENRSFDHLFGFLSHPKKYNGLTGNESNPVSATNSKQIKVYKTTKTSISPDPPHSHEEILKQMNLGIGGVNDGFVSIFADKKAAKGGSSDIKEIMASIDSDSEKKCGFIMAELARKFVLCDNWHSSVPGETWPNRNFAHAATSGGEVNIVKKFYSDKTVFQAVADHGLKWQIYHDGPPQAWVFYKLWFKKNGGYREFDKFKKDVENDALANYIFIEPKHFGFGNPTNNMHPGNNSEDSSTDFKNAENLVAYIYNTLNLNKKVFNKSLLVVTFDEHGGFYDHVPPPNCTPPDNKVAEKGFKFDKYGFRVPTLIISPYAKSGYIDSTLYDHTSIIKSVFENFEIPGHLTNRDKNANSFLENSLVSRKKSGAEPVKEHKIIATKSRTKAAGPETYNDFQQDLLELTNNVDFVMADSVKAVEDKIKLLETRTRTKSAKSLATVDPKAVEARFLEKYGKKG